MRTLPKPIWGHSYHGRVHFGCDEIFMIHHFESMNACRCIDVRAFYTGLCDSYPVDSLCFGLVASAGSSN
jgi:hypothetical protein